VASNSDLTLTSDFPGILILQTAPVTAGTYFVNASSLLDLDSGASSFCYTTTVNGAAGTNNFGGSGVGGGFQQASNADVFTVSQGDAFQLFCYSSPAASASLFESTLTATLINSASDASKKRHHSRAIQPPNKLSSVR
jgi:hypothetical protein